MVPGLGSKTERNIVAAVVAAGLIVLVFYFVRDAHPGRGYLDRNAFNWDIWYCGAQAISQHRDPYLVEPIRSCEHFVRGRSFGNNWKTWVVIPMPLPGYSLAILWPLLKLPFLVMKAVWIGLVLAALLATAWFSSRLTRLPFAAVLLIFAPTIGVLNIVYGGLEPIGILALCAGAFALERNRPAVAGTLSVLACIEPHLGLPAAVATFVLVPRSRVAIGLTASVFALATVALLGWPTVLEYVRGVLPEQSSGEAVLSHLQYSLAHVLHLAGVTTKIATTLGSISYLAAIAFGTYAASRIRALYARPAAILLVPVAVSLLGGLYVHNHQITAALPGALLLATLPFRGRWLAVAAAALLAFPWEFATRSLEILACLAVCTSILLLATEIPPARRVMVASVTPVLFALGWSFADALPSGTFALAARPETIAAADLATSAWTKFLLWTPGRAVESASTLLLKVPWWLALLALTLAAIMLCVPSRRLLRAQ
jgi:hypothetical protein